MSIFDTSTFSEVVEVSVGSNPEGVIYHPDGSKIYVANLSSDTVSVIDTETYSVTQTIPVGDGPVQFGFNSNASRLYVTNYFSASVSEIDVETGSVLRTFNVGAGPIDVQVVDQYLYVTNHDDNSVSVVDLSSGATVETISGFNGPHSIAASAPPASALSWHVEYVDCPKVFADMTDRTLALGTGSSRSWMPATTWEDIPHWLWIRTSIRTSATTTGTTRP